MKGIDLGWFPLLSICLTIACRLAYINSLICPLQLKLYKGFLKSISFKPVKALPYLFARHCTYLTTPSGMKNTQQELDTTDKSSFFRVAKGVHGLRTLIVNVYFVKDEQGWVLIDAGLWFSANRIKQAAEDLYGKGTRPKAIILTHGHFDHVGALRELIEEWNVPVYAHPLEFPYLTGLSSYPPPDPTVGGGGMAYMSWMYPKAPMDLNDHVRPLSPDGSIPQLKDWRWIHTPGHTAGHVSLYREKDLTLIAGDAFVTVNQESVYAVMTQKQEIHGPPAYFTSDWRAAQRSVQKLAHLRPLVVATGHGMPMHGSAMQFNLRALADHFDELAIPSSGRYVKQPAYTNERGVVSLPPDPLPAKLATLGLATLAGIAVAALIRQTLKKRDNEDVFQHNSKAFGVIDE
jgi:glyoxylase-like metal-dependent hydrolase (beta-lactamase superfamily II)